MSGSRVHLSVENGSVVLSARANGEDAKIFGDAVFQAKDNGALFGNPTITKGVIANTINLSEIPTIKGHGGHNVTEIPTFSEVTTTEVLSARAGGIIGRN